MTNCLCRVISLSRRWNCKQYSDVFEQIFGYETDEMDTLKNLIQLGKAALYLTHHKEAPLSAMLWLTQALHII